eukprot:1195604-Prorocentrum_minimum.AAC.2
MSYPLSHKSTLRATNRPPEPPIDPGAANRLPLPQIDPLRRRIDPLRRRIDPPKTRNETLTGGGYLGVSRAMDPAGDVDSAALQQLPVGAVLPLLRHPGLWVCVDPHRRVGGPHALRSDGGVPAPHRLAGVREGAATDQAQLRDGGEGARAAGGHAGHRDLL